MRRPIAALLLVMLLVPTWSAEPPRAMFRGDLTVTATRYTPPGGWPRRIGALEPIGAVSLHADQPDFGGFSAIALYGGQAILVSDIGQVVRLRFDAGRWLTTFPVGGLRDGPGTGWRKESRDAEALAIDPAMGRGWIAYERANEIWRYASDLDHAEAFRRPVEMRDWGRNTGPESLARLPDGRFLALREGEVKQVGARPALLFDGDPSDPATRIRRLRYLPPAGFAPSDAAALPGGDVLVLNRRWHFPLRFQMVLTRIPRAQLHEGALLTGPVVAQFGEALGGENAEGIAVARQDGRTTIWIVTDNDGAFWRRTILAAFRLVE